MGPISFTKEHTHCLLISCRAVRPCSSLVLQSFPEGKWSLRDWNDKSIFCCPSCPLHARTQGYPKGVKTLNYLRGRQKDRVLPWYGARKVSSWLSVICKWLQQGMPRRAMKRQSEELSVVLNLLGSSSSGHGLRHTLDPKHLQPYSSGPHTRLCLFSFFHKPTRSLAYSMYIGCQESPIMSLKVPTSNS